MNEQMNGPCPQRASAQTLILCARFPSRLKVLAGQKWVDVGPTPPPYPSTRGSCTTLASGTEGGAPPTGNGTESLLPSGRALLLSPGSPWQSLACRADSEIPGKRRRAKNRQPSSREGQEQQQEAGGGRRRLVDSARRVSGRRGGETHACRGPEPLPGAGSSWPGVP